MYRVYSHQLESRVLKKIVLHIFSISNYKPLPRVRYLVENSCALTSKWFQYNLSLCNFTDSPASDVEASVERCMMVVKCRRGLDVRKWGHHFHIVDS